MRENGRLCELCVCISALQEPVLLLFHFQTVQELRFEFSLFITDTQLTTFSTIPFELDL
jgi:hypothetical protein